MRGTALLLCFVFVANVALAQAPACSTFETTLDGWKAVNASATPASGNGRRYADVRDGSGASNFFAPAAYHGKWLRRTYGCGSICFDVNVADDGFPGSTPVRPYFVIEDGAGHSATFLSNATVEGSGWRTVCAPIAPLADGALPASREGEWRLGQNTTAAGWEALLENVKTFRLAIDVHSSLAERLQFDNVCFRPKTCVTAPPDSVPIDQMQMAPNVTNWKDCPKDCVTVTRHAGESYNVCTMVRRSPPGKSKGLMQYIPGTANGQTCDPGIPLDVEKRHRLFVHGIHSDRWAWDEWIQRVKPQMDHLGYRTVADQTGATVVFGAGSAALLTQVNELAAQINSGFANVPDGSVWVYAHSLGALKMEALLQLGYLAGTKCGFGAACTDPLYRAAAKIREVTVFQGAHGGCTATTLIGDRPYHGPLPCPASLDIGRVNDSRFLPPPLRVIPGTSTLWNMNQVVWRGRGPLEKRMRYVVATSKGAPSSMICKGASGLICSDERIHDGAVYAEQMVPTFYADYEQALQAGLVTVTEETRYCHADEDTYEPPRLSATLMIKYVGLLQGPYDYFVGKLETITPVNDIATCNQECFCIRDRLSACASKIDCTRFEKPPFASCVTFPPTGEGGGGGGFVDIWAAAAKTNEQVGSWTRCAAEGGLCAVSGTRLVRYGANGKYNMATITNSTPCTNAVFGDPVSGVLKTCESLSEPQLNIQRPQTVP